LIVVFACAASLAEKLGMKMAAVGFEKARVRGLGCLGAWIHTFNVSSGSGSGLVVVRVSSDMQGFLKFFPM
jgi:hypothetical protein